MRRRRGALYSEQMRSKVAEEVRRGVTRGYYARDTHGGGFGDDYAREGAFAT